MQEEDLYKVLLSTINKVPTTVRPRPPKDEIELDDQAPLALIICIAAPVFIGFVILVLIYCCCRRKPTNISNGASSNAAGNTTAYHRAPDGEGNNGMGVGVSYPMTAVSTPYPGGYHPGPIPPSSQAYRMPASMAPSPLPSYPSQQVPVPPGPHFGGVPATYPPPPVHPYPPGTAVYLPPSSHPHTHSFSHSSQASSVSGATTVEPCVVIPSSPPQQHHPVLPHHQQQQQQFHHHPHHHYLQQQQQQPRFYHHPHLPQQLQQQMQGAPPGHESPAPPMHHYPTAQQPPLSQPHLVQPAEPSVTGTTLLAASPPSPAALSAVSSPSESYEPAAKIKSDTAEENASSVGLLQPEMAAEQDLGYSDEEE